MVLVFDRYNKLTDVLDATSKKNIHFKSLKNFIINLGEFKSIEEAKECEKKINEYLDIVEQNIDVLDRSFAIHLFAEYVFPLGKTYKKIGFKHISPVQSLVIFALMADLLIAILFWPFPYPIITVLVLINFYLIKKYHKSSRIFGMFY